MLYDTDFGFDLYDGAAPAAASNTLAFATAADGTDWPNPEWSTLILRKLLENNTFKQDFINRFADLLNTHFRPDRVTGIISQMRETLEPEMPGHQERWKHPWHSNWNTNTWRSDVQVMTDYANARPAHQRQHLRDHFGLGGEYQLTLNSDLSQGHIRINSVEIQPSTPGVPVNAYPWSGTYFRGVPIELEAIAAPGYTFSHWSGLPEGTPAKTRLTPVGNLQVSAHFTAGQPPFLHAWVFDSTLANDTAHQEIGSSISHTDVQGRIRFQSALPGYPHTGGRATMERRNAPTPINYSLEAPYNSNTMRGLQVKQPFQGAAGENALILDLPTTSYSRAVLRFAAKDEGAADSLLIDYATNSGTPLWTTASLSQSILPLGSEFQLYTVNFAGINAVDDNPHFKVRIRFAGNDMTADNGDRVTFNNITLDLQQEQELVYFWLFDNTVPNDIGLDNLAPRFAALPGARIQYHSALPGYPETGGKASLERRNSPTSINYLAEGNYRLAFSDVNMRGIQVKQPFQGAAGENALVFHMPTTGIANPIFRFAAMDENAATQLRIDYATNPGQPHWTTTGLSGFTLPLLTSSYQAHEVDFAGLAAVNNNPHFRVRIRFAGNDMTADNGDRVTFNNISLHSRPGSTPSLPPVPPDPANPNAPANNRFAYAQPISGPSGSSLGTNVDANRETGEPDHAGQLPGVTAGPGVWWRWTAPYTDRMLFRSNQSGIDSLVAVYQGSELVNLRPVHAGQPTTDRLWFLAEAGETYHILVAGIGDTQGDLALTWESAEPAAAPIVIDSQPGQPGIICDMPGCGLDNQGNLYLYTDTYNLHVLLPDDGVHSHRLQALSDQAQVLWSTEFEGRLPATLSRVIADVAGQPVIITGFTGPQDNQYHVEAFPDGRARLRVLAADGSELFHLTSLIPGLSASIDLQAEGRLILAAPGAAQLRALLELDDEARPRMRYQRLNTVSDSWEDASELLSATRFPPGTRVLLEQGEGRMEIRIDTRIINDLYF